jgi:hypothetical protein
MNTNSYDNRPTTLVEEHEVEAIQNCGVFSFIDWASFRTATQRSADEAHTIKYLHKANLQVSCKLFLGCEAFVLAQQLLVE